MRCVAVLLGRTWVVSVCALDSDKSLEDYEEFRRKSKKILREGRQYGARRYFVEGDLNVDGNR